MFLGLGIDASSLPGQGGAGPGPTAPTCIPVLQIPWGEWSNSSKWKEFYRVSPAEVAGDGCDEDVACHFASMADDISA